MSRIETPKKIKVDVPKESESITLDELITFLTDLKSKEGLPGHTVIEIDFDGAPGTISSAEIYPETSTVILY